jgi:hypothetical protein
MMTRENLLKYNNWRVEIEVDGEKQIARLRSKRPEYAALMTGIGCANWIVVGDAYFLSDAQISTLEENPESGMLTSRISLSSSARWRAARLTERTSTLGQSVF